MKKLFFLTFLLLFVFRAQAQKDYRPGFIVNLQGDTLKGKVNFKGDIKNAQECTFRASESAAEQNFKPGQLRGYGFTDGKIYEAKPARIINRQLNPLTNQFEVIPVVGNDTINFMQVLVKGPATLYFLKDATSAPHYFLQLREKPIQELVYLKVFMTDHKTGAKQNYQSKLYVGVLKAAFSDCVLIGPKVEKTDFKPSALQNIFTEYNQCIAPNQKTFVKANPKAVVTWGAMVGASFSDLTITADQLFISQGDYSSKPAPTAGLFIDFTLPVLNEKLSINNGLYFTKRNYTANFNYATSDLAFSNYRVAYKFSYLRLETALRYTMPARKFTPYGQLGLSNSFMLNNQEEINSTKYYLNYPPTENNEPQVLTPIFRKHQLGFVGATGLKHALKRGNQLFLQANYEFNTGFTDAKGFGTNSHNFALVLGVGF